MEEEYEIDVDFEDVDRIIQEQVQKLDITSQVENVLRPIKVKMKDIEDRNDSIGSIFTDLRGQLESYWKTLEGFDLEGDGEVIELSDPESDDDVQFVEVTYDKSLNEAKARQKHVARSAASALEKALITTPVKSKKHLSGPYYRHIPQPKLPTPRQGMKIYAKKYNEVWVPGTLIEAINSANAMEVKFKVKIDNRYNKVVQGKHVALHSNYIKYSRLPVGTRIIALYTEGGAKSYYAGVVAERPCEQNNYRYLVFFDDGYAQYSSIKTVHKVYVASDNVWEDIHPDSQEFIRSYLEEYPERPMVKLLKSTKVTTEWNGEWWTAKVLEVDASLVNMWFEADERVEWIYRGSTRLEPLYTELANAEASKTNRKGGRRHNFNVKDPKKPYVEYTKWTDADEDKIITETLTKDETTVNVKQTARKSTGGNVAKKSTGGVDKSSDAGNYKWEAPWLKPRKPSTETQVIDLDAKSTKAEPKSTNVSTSSNHGVSNQKSSKDIASVLQQRLAADVDEESMGERVEVDISSKILPEFRGPRNYVSHKICGIKCRTVDDNPMKFRGYNPLWIPIIYGWERQLAKTKNGKYTVYYTGPCGRRIRNIEEVVRYLNVTDSKLTVDLFTYDSYVHILMEFVPVKTFCDIKDLSYGKESVPISCVNGIDRQYPDYVEYSNQRLPAKGVKLNLDADFLMCCDCTDGCKNRSKCACQQLAVKASAVNTTDGRPDPDAGYNHRRLDEVLITGLYECNSRCKCDHRCLNRVAQNGLQLRLQVFKTEKRGWGIRCLDDIPPGGFICIYAGQLLNDQGANEDGHQYGDEYLAELDHIEVVERLKEGYEEEVVDPPTDDEAEEEKKDKEDENSEEELSEDSYSQSSGSDSDFMSKAKCSDRGIVRTRRGGRRRTSKDSKEVGKIVLKRNSREGKAKKMFRSKREEQANRVSPEVVSRENRRLGQGTT